MRNYFNGRRMTRIFLSLTAVLSMTLTACGAGDNKDSAQIQTAQAESEAGISAGASEGEAQAAQASEKDDYYEAINRELIDSWEIEPDESVKNWFSILQDRVDERITEMIRNVSEESETEEGSDESNVRAMYLTGMDKTARDRGGFGEIVSSFFDEVDAADSVEELMGTCMQFNRDYGLYSVFGLYVGTDYEDSSARILSADAGDHGLNKEIWFSDDESNQKMTAAFEELLKKFCVIEGYSEKEAGETAKTIAAFMKTLAQKALSQSELYEPEKTYNVYTVSELEELFSGNISSEMVEEIYGVKGDDRVIVSELEKVKLMGSLLTEENLSLLKKYVKLCVHKDLSSYIDMDSYDAVAEYQMAAAGTEESSPFEEMLIVDIQRLLGFECGRLYCENWYSEETTEDVSRIIDQVIETFDRRIEALDWMSDATKAEAKNKLAELDVRVGHPDSWPQDRYELILAAPEDGGLYIDNYMRAAKAASDYSFAAKEEPVDRALWPDTPQTVNAYYNPQNNSINILAGILQDPIYDPDASIEENLGGIGTVIGHEITHAFDTSGALFDENGNLRDWWTAADKEKFQALAGEVISYYDGMEVNGRTVNGEQTVTENIADLGGVSCITEIAESEGCDLKKLYKSYATVWASKEREEYSAMLMALDVHAPSKIRVNAVLSAQQEFRDLYNITQGDGMFQEQMPEIW